MNTYSEFDKEGAPFDAVLPSQCSTLRSISAGAILWDISEGTRYCRVRVDFHPYAQFTKVDRLTFVAALHQQECRLRPDQA